MLPVWELLVDPVVQCVAARHHRGATQPCHRLQGGRPAGRSRGVADLGGRSVAGQQSVAADRDLPPLSHRGCSAYPRATGFGHDAPVAVLELIHPGVARLPLVRDHRTSGGAGAVANLRAGSSLAGLSRRGAADARASGRDRRRGAHAVSARLRSGGQHAGRNRRKRCKARCLWPRSWRRAVSPAIIG